MKLVQLDDVYKSSAFRLLAQGMKDRKAIEIVVLLMHVDDVWNNFETWAEARLKEENNDAS